MPNRLAGSASPYLRQHADNPVDWYPWGPEALDRAQAEGRPILLSIGYSACHWCHVMEHESFSDEGTASTMNAHFVCVKVDREERPDLDTIYMTAVQAFTGGHGGWPMTLFLLPDGRPFLAGTYFPPEPRHGLPSFGQLMERAVHLYRHDTSRCRELAERVRQHLETAEAVPEIQGVPSGGDWLGKVFEVAVADYDDTWGGFGSQPKFPPHATLAALIGHVVRTGDADALAMITGTLDAMMRGGTYDLLGGGFCRYAVDPAWRIPHFEKMLYDNAQLVPLYVDGWRLTGHAPYARVARETLDYVARDLTGPEGAFLASEDADSEGEEGRFYAWTPAQLREVLGDDAPRAAELLQVTEAGTFEHGTSVLRLDQPWEELPTADRELVDRALLRLARARDGRVRPAKDDKRITAWNALMIRAFAVGGTALEAPWYVDRARGAARFLLQHATVEGRLMRVWSGGVARHPGFLDDHAFLVLALVDLWEATADPRWLDEALALVTRTLDLFWDEPTGTCLFVGRDAEPLIATPRKLVGGAEPSGNGVLAWALARLAVLCGRDDLGERADRILAAYAPYAERVPRALGYEAVAWSWRQGSTREVGLVLPHEDARPERLLREVHRTADPFRVLATVVEGQVPDVVPWMADRPALAEQVTAYVCSRGTCRLPATTPEALREELEAAPR